MMTASFKYVVKTYEVTLDICVRIGDAVAYSCLGGEVDYNVYLIFGEEILFSVKIFSTASLSAIEA